MSPRAPLEERQWYTVGQAAEYLGIAQTSFRKWVDAGLLESFRTPGGHRRVTREVLDRFLLGEGNGATAPTRRVLVIDDDASVRELLRVCLEDAGFEVVEADSAAQGITRINEQVPDLLMLDILMPGADGWEMLRMLREKLDVEELPVLVFSGQASLDAADERGAQAYAHKPFDPTRLVAQARLLCESPASNG